MGIAHGAFCVGCCWSLMLVMFGVGLGSLTAMLALGGLTADREEPAVGSPAHAGRSASSSSWPPSTRSPVTRGVVCSARGWHGDRERRAPGPSAASGRRADTRARDPRRGAGLPAAPTATRPVDAARRRGRRASRSARSTTTSAASSSSSWRSSRPRTPGSSSASARCTAGRSRSGGSGSGPATSSTTTSSPGYVRVLQEMIAAGWSDPEVAAAVREHARRLVPPAGRGRRARGAAGRRPRAVHARGGRRADGPAVPRRRGRDPAGLPESELPTRSALRKIGLVLRDLGERPATDGRDQAG